MFVRALLVGVPDVTAIAPASGQQPQRGLQIRPSLMMIPCGAAPSAAAFTADCDVMVTVAAEAGLLNAMDAEARPATAPIAVA
jgi:hypothetical protein